jgi:hypothetical protein
MDLLAEEEADVNKQTIEFYADTPLFGSEPTPMTLTIVKR